MSSPSALTVRIFRIVRLVLIAAVAGAAMPAGAGDDGFGHSGPYLGVGGAVGVDLFEDVLEDAAEPNGVNVDIEETSGVNARAGYRFASWIALELMYEWMDSFRVEVDSVDAGGTPLPVGSPLAEYTTHTGTLNLKLIVPTWRLQPYLLLGVGGQYFELDAPAAVQGTAFDFSDRGWAFAGRPGVGLDLYLTRHILLNAEVSGVLSTADPGTVPSVGDLFYLSAGGGIQYRF